MTRSIGASSNMPELTVSPATMKKVMTFQATRGLTQSRRTKHARERTTAVNASIRMVRDAKCLVDDVIDGKPVQQSQADVDHDAERQRLHAEAKQEPVVDAEGTVRGGHPCIGEDETGRGLREAPSPSPTAPPHPCSRNAKRTTETAARPRRRASTSGSPPHAQYAIGTSLPLHSFATEPAQQHIGNQKHHDWDDDHHGADGRSTRRFRRRHHGAVPFRLSPDGP